MSEVVTTSKYKPYPAYKNSGIEWLGEVPEHWELKRNKFIFKIRKRIAGSIGLDVLSITQKGIKIKDIESGEGQLSMDYSKYQIVEAGDFAMNHMDLLTGYVDVSKTLGVTSPDYRVFSIIDNNTVSNFFLALFQHGYHQKIFYAFGQGASHLGRWRLPTDEFENFVMPYPSQREQIQIANFLDQETSKIDTLIEKQQTLVELIKVKITSLALNEQINGKGKEERLRHLVEVINRPVSIKDEEEYEALGLYNRGRGLFHKPKKPGKEMGESDFYYVESGDLIISGQFAWEGAVTMATDHENGCVVSHRYPILRGKSIDTEYLLSLLFTEYGDFLLNESSRGSAGRNRPLNLGLLLNEKIRVPTRQAQDELNRLIKLKTAAERKTQQAIVLLKERKTALISAAVTGKIDVRGVS